MSLGGFGVSINWVKIFFGCCVFFQRKRSRKPTSRHGKMGFVFVGKIPSATATVDASEILLNIWEVNKSCNPRRLDPQTPPEKAFRGSKHPLTRYLGDFGRLG